MATGSVRVMHPVSSAGALVGRDSELAALTELVREVARGRARSVLIEGEPGIGKSALVRAVANAAPTIGCEVFWGAGDELSQELPLLPFLDGLRVREASGEPRRAAIVRLLRGEGLVDRADVPTVLAEQLLALIAEQCAARPTMLVIDDLQWADPATVTLWGRLAKSPRRMPLLLAGILRPVPARPDLLVLRRTVDGAAHLHLAGLTKSAVADLVAVLVGRKPDDNLLQLADGAGGNPLYLTELIAALARSSALAITGAGTAELASESVPSSLSAAIADRLGFVTDPAREMLQAAALLGADFSVDDLSIVLARRVIDLLPSINEACAAGVLAEVGTNLGFRHPLIRATLYNEMPASVRAAWHRDAGRAFAAAGVSADRVARQMLRAVSGSPGFLDEWMLEWLAGPADPLIVQAPTAAVELFTRAIASSMAGSPRYVLLASRLAAALYRNGDRPRAEQVAEHALEYATDPDLLVDLHSTLAMCRMRASSAVESLDSLDRALAAPGISPRHRARLLVLAARTHDAIGEVTKAGEAASGALAVASEVGDAWARGWALHVLALVAAQQGHVVDALPTFDQALAATDSEPALIDLHLLVQLNKSVALAAVDQCEAATEMAKQARDLADKSGSVIRLGQAHSAYGQLLYEIGRWEDALSELLMIPQDLKEPGAACIDLGSAAVIRFHRGEVSAARRHIAAVAPYAAQLGRYRFISVVLLARSLDREHEGDLPGALAELLIAFDEHTEELDELAVLSTEGVRLAVKVGDLNAARAIARSAAEFSGGAPVPHRQADALYCRGLLDRDASLLLAAAELYDDASRPLQQAKALESAAGELISVGETHKARAAFSRAAEVYTELGAAADLARIQAEFRAYGIRRGPHTKHRTARNGWDSLTPAEIKVAGFVEEGLSNPEIAARLMLSPRTVATHVSHILKKLDLQSRTEIARESVLRTVVQR